MHHRLAARLHREHGCEFATPTRQQAPNYTQETS